MGASVLIRGTWYQFATGFARPAGDETYGRPRLCSFHRLERSGADPEGGFGGNEVERVVDAEAGAERAGRSPGAATPPEHLDAIAGRERSQARHRRARAGGDQRVAAPDAADLDAAPRPRVGRDPF